MKIRKFMLGIIIIMLLYLTGCGSNEPEQNVFTEVHENMIITYAYNLHDDTLISKNVYDSNTGLTTEYNYFYKPESHGGTLMGVSIVTITKEGKVTGDFNFSINE